MKRILKAFILFLLLFFAMTVGSAAEEDYLGEFSEIVESEEFKDPDFIKDSLSPEKVFSDISDKASAALSDMAPRLLVLLGLSVLSALASLYSGRYKDGVACGISVLTTLVAYAGVIDIFTEITDSMSEMSSLFSSLIPLFSSVMLSGGGGYSSAGLSLGMATTVSFFSGVVTPVFVTLLAVMLALGLLFCFGVPGALGFMQSIKRHTLFLISLVGCVLLGTVSLQTVLSSARDNAAMRAVKHLAQTTIPLVGGAVSASLSTLWGGLSLTKGMIGIGGILVIVGIFLGPLISLLIYKLAVGILTAAEGFFSVSSHLPRISECLDLIIGVYSISSVIYIFEIVLFINGGVTLS